MQFLSHFYIHIFSLIFSINQKLHISRQRKRFSCTRRCWHSEGGGQKIAKSVSSGTFLPSCFAVVRSHRGGCDRTRHAVRWGDPHPAGDAAGGGHVAGHRLRPPKRVTGGANADGAQCCHLHILPEMRHQFSKKKLFPTDVCWCGGQGRDQVCICFRKFKDMPPIYHPV